MKCRMADSDDEFDRRRRDKFTRERNDYRDRREYERDNYGRGGREYGRDYDRRRAYSPLRGGGSGGGRDLSPPMKRSRYDSEQGLSQPAMMTFKQFLANQDDCIDDQDAVKKYADYKTEFKRQQLEEFFKNHKDEEWFRMKYHPDECHKRKEESQANILKRLEVYKKIRDMGLLDNAALDVDKNNDLIIRLMDTVAIFLEGGDEEDLKALDEPEGDMVPQTLELIRLDPPKKAAPERKSPETIKSDSPGKIEQDSKTSEGSDKSNKDNESQNLKDSDEEKKPQKAKDPWSSDEDTREADNGKKSDSNVEDEKEKHDRENISNSQKGEPVKRPRHLHRTSSIFLRTLSPAITKQEVEAMCRNYNGFLRVALADPQVEKKFARRGWVTFERNVNTKEICWKLNNIRLRDTELGAILNRDLTRRVRSVNGITASKQVMKSDIKLAAKIIQNLDTQRELHMNGGESKNPLLANITDYLIEEASAEEEELLGENLEEGKGENGNALEKDEELTKVLDRLLLYLRIVHSMDYYAHSEYQNEDEMPNRCGIIHARGSMPTSFVSAQEIEDYTTNFAQKCAVFVEPSRTVSLEDAKKLGLKNESDEVEKFMNANCQQLDKDKFLCPLSGKKFKAPEFVHKHIQNRHGEKIDEVKKNVIYFNNYIMDPKRPSLPEHPSNRPRTNNPSTATNHSDTMGAGPYGHYNGPGPYGYPPRPGYGLSNYPVRGYPPPEPYRYGGNKRGGYGGGGPRGIRDPRPVVAYHDLDVPPEFDLF